MAKEKLEYLTCIFKLHNLSKKKREMIDHAFAVYTKEMKKLLDYAHQNEETVKIDGAIVRKDNSLKYTERSIAKALPKPSQLTPLLASTVNEALVANVASELASYFSLKQLDDKHTTGFPETRNPDQPLIDYYAEALHDFCSVHLGDYNSKREHVEAEKEARDKFLHTPKSNVMPIHFGRSRDFNILWDKDNDRFFAYLKLFGSKQGMEKVVIVQGNLVDVNTGEVFRVKSNIGIIVPLEIGRRNGDWHWQYHKYIKQSLEGVAMIKSAKLLKKDDDYYIHVAFGFEGKEPHEPLAYIGVDRGVFFTMAYAIVNNRGQVIEANHEDDGFRDDRIKAGKRVQEKQKKGLQVTIKDYRRQHHDTILHNLTNKLIRLAKQYQAAIVLEDLNIRIRGKFYKSAWRKFHGIIEYKARIEGVPVMTRWAAYTSQICIKCGEIAERDDRQVTCKECGNVQHSDEGAGVNIARRGMYKKKDWGGTAKKAGNWKEFHKSFANLPLFADKNEFAKSESSGYSTEERLTL